MKYKFFKNKKAQVYVIITTMLLCVSACAFSSFDCFAEKVTTGNNGDLTDIYDFSDEYIESDESIQTIDKITSSEGKSSIIEWWSDVLAEGLPYKNSFPSGLNNYILMSYRSVGTAYDGAFYGIYPCTDNTIIFSKNDGSVGSRAFIPYDEYVQYNLSNLDFYSYFYSYYDNDVEDYHYEYNNLLYYFQDQENEWFYIDDVRYVGINLNDYWSGLGSGWGQNGKPYIQYTTCPIYYFEGNDFSEINGTSLDDYTQSNPSYNGGSNTEDIVNHLTLKDDTKFYISNSSFNTGNLYIYPVFDKTQLDENETLNQYYLRLTGTVSTNTTYNSGSTQYKAKVNGKRVTTYFPMTNGSSNIYNFSLGSSGGSYYDIPLSSVNNGKYEISFSQLHKLFYGSGSNDNNYELLARGYDSLYGGTSYFESVSNFIGGISVKGFNYNPQTSADIDIVPTKVHYHLDLYVVKKSLDEESISDVQSYIDGDLCDGNGISGENVNTSSDEDIMNALGTDYVPNEYTSPETNTDYKDTYNNVGGSSSSSSGGNSVSPSITGGNNNIVITNNNTNNGSGSGNNTSESSLVGSTIVTTLIKYIAGNKSSSVSYIEDIAGTNTYLQIVSNYMSFVPTEIWSLVVTCFSVCIGVVVVAFIISIVIKIIT